MTLHSTPQARPGLLRLFQTDRGGSVLMMFALALVPIFLALGAVIDYQRTAMTKARLQEAVDEAALAAANRPTLTQAARQSIAQTLVLSNLGPMASTINPVVTETEPSGNYNVTVSASVPTTMMRYANVSSVAISSTATAVAATSSSSAVTHYTGNGSVAGDPHIVGADGSDGYLTCASPSGSWYNLLSDSGIEVNVSCVTYPGVWADVIQSFSILLGSHVVTLYAPSPTFDSSKNASYDASTAWFGQITIDGVTHPPAMGQHSYLNGLVKTKITDLANFYASDNMVHINTGTYNIYVTYDAYAMGDINITATNAGLCGVPGGFWGGTLAGHEDYNGGDFLVSGPTATAPQFNWATCPASANVMAHLIH
jgi:Flp pilus assembly protein TadG